MSSSQSNVSFFSRATLLLISVALLGGCQHFTEPSSKIEQVRVSSQGMVAPHGMVASGHRLASEAGVEILEIGGNAIDAAVATAFALGVVDTGNAGLGGGGSLLVWFEEEKRTDFAEFYSRAGSSPREESGAGRNVAIPGHAAGLLDAHERYGKLSRETVLAPAIKLARNGFAVPVNLAESLVTHQKKIEENAPPEAVEIFYPNGEPLQPGDWLVQEEKAATLERVAAEGRDGFYKGEIADKLIADLNASGNAATLEDLAGYKTRWLRPLAGGFREYTVLSAPPPLGGTQVVQPLVLLDSFSLREEGLPSESAAAANQILDAIRIGRRDYNRWVFDPQTPVPGNGLTSAEYALTRIDEIGVGEVSKSEKTGNPWEFDREIDPRFAHLDPWAPSERNSETKDEGTEETEEVANPEEPSEEHTTHLSVVDSDRNAVAITMTLGPSFGAGFYSSGVFYNNGLTRFGKTPKGNQWAPYRTPRSNTSPTIVLEEDRLRLVTGAQGGSRIPAAIVFNILYAIEYDLSASEAMAGARAFPFMFSPVIRVEAGFENEALTLFRERGYNLEPYIQQDNYFGGAHMIVVEPDGRLHGAADMRRAGTAVGY